MSETKCRVEIGVTSSNFLTEAEASKDRSRLLESAAGDGSVGEVEKGPRGRYSYETGFPCLYPNGPCIRELVARILPSIAKSAKGRCSLLDNSSKT